MSRLQRSILVAVAALLPLAGLAAFAQQDATREDPATNAAPREAARTPAQPGQASANAIDEKLAACLLIENQAEVALSRFAQDRATSPQVKQFAQMMVKDHSNFIEKLRPLAGNQWARFGVGFEQQPNAEQPANIRTRTTTRTEENRQPSAAPQPPAEAPNAATETRTSETTAEVNPAAGHAGHADLLGIKREVAQQCLALAQRELEQKQQNEFDRCYMGHAVMAHQQMLAALTVFKRHASPQFEELLTQGTQTTQQHLDQAKTLLKQLEGTPANTARRPATQRSQQ